VRLVASRRLLDLLEILGEKGCVGQYELKSVLPAATAVVAVNSAARFGLVRVDYQRGGRGRPRKLVCLTDKGRKVLDCLRELARIEDASLRH